MAHLGLWLLAALAWGAPPHAAPLTPPSPPHVGQPEPQGGLPDRRRSTPAQATHASPDGFPSSSVVEFLAVFAKPPVANPESVVPLKEDERATWNAKVTEWRTSRDSLLDRTKQILTAAPAGTLPPDVAGALGALKTQLELSATQDKAGEWGNLVVIDDTRAAALDSAQLLLEYAKALAAGPSDPGISPAEREQAAAAAALAKVGEKADPTEDELDRLGAHHKAQLKKLLLLRKALRKSGNLSKFAAELRKDTRPKRGLNAKKKKA